MVDEKNGVWGPAIEVPGTAALNSTGYAYVQSVSCASAGNCAAGGSYYDGSDIQAFVVDEKNGVWGPAIEVPGTATLNSDGYAEVSRSRAAARATASPGGYYNLGVVTQVGEAFEVPGTATLNTRGQASLSSISCATAGNCAAGGSYYGKRGLQAFLVRERGGVWAYAVEIPGTASLNRGGMARPWSVSCTWDRPLR